MFDENQPDRFENGRTDAGEGARREHAAPDVRESAQDNPQGETDGREQGNGQNRQDDYPYHNYYSDRYRSGQGTAEGHAGEEGYPYSVNGYGENPRKPKKKGQKARVAVAIVLAAVFIGFCGGVSWLAVNSLQEQLDGDSVVRDGEDSDGAAYQEAEESLPEPVQEEEAAMEPDREEAADSAIRESKTVTAVVTDVTDVVEQVMPACVSITNSYTQQFQDFWGQSYSRDEEASGSGIVIGENDSELLIVTNYHVVDSANVLYVQFIDGQVLEAQVKGVDSTVDLAVVAVALSDIGEETRDAICIAKMGDSDNLKMGEPAIAIGNALGYGQSVTTGVISALNRTLEVSETGTSNALIQTDAAINPGNSGGALLNIKGEVVGINSNKIGGTAVEGMGYAIPISTAKPIIEELMTHQTRLRVADEDRGYLGVSCINVTSEVTETFSIPEGVFVAQVYEGTGADRAGLVRGDIIIAVDDTKIRNREELTKYLGYYQAGETVKLTIMQGSPNGFVAKDVEVTLSTLDEVNAGSLQSLEEEQPGRRQWRLP